MTGMANRTTINLPKVAPVVLGDDPAVDVKAVAERVDRVLTHLENQMKNFEAADVTEVSGTPASTVVSGSNSMYFQTFEDDITEQWAFLDGTAAAVTFPLNGQAGGHALRTTLTEVLLEDDTYIPFDPSRLYRMRTRFRHIAGATRSVYVGVRCYDSSKVLIGTYQRVCASAVNNGAWHTDEGYFKGAASAVNITVPSVNSYTPNSLRTGTSYIRPYIHLSVGGDTQTAELDYITLEILTETQEVDKLVQNVGGRAVGDVASTIRSGGTVDTDQVTNDGLAADAVDGGGLGGKNVIKAGTIQAANILAGTITANEIFANTITVDELATLTGAGLTIKFSATGAEKVFDHASFYITAAGDAVFSGTVAASAFTAGTITMDGSLELKCAEAVVLAKIFPVAADSAGLLLESSIADKPGFTLYNTGAARLILTDTRNGTDVAGTFGVEVPVEYKYARYQSWIATFGDGDATPSVADSGYPVQLFQTANTGATTITDFDDQEPNQVITIIVKDAVTTFGFSGARLEGNNDADWLATDGEVLQFVYNFTDDLWHLISVVPASRDNTVSPLYPSTNVVVTDCEINGALNHDGATVGFFGTAPQAQNAGWEEFANLSSDKTCNADSTSTEELADILGTLIKTLCDMGLLSAVV